MDLGSFIIENGVIGTFIGTIAGFAITNYFQALEKNVIRPFILERFRVTGASRMGNVASATLELIVVILIVYLMYRWIVVPLFRTQLERRKASESEQNEWKDRVGSNLDRIRTSLTG
jgi:large-conductance mechanosensitive channel